MNNDVFHVLQPILADINWVCPPCISSIREKRKLDDQIQSLSTALHKLEADHLSLVQKVDGMVTATSSAATVVQSNGSTFIQLTHPTQLHETS